MARKPFPTDQSDEPWRLIEPSIPPPVPGDLDGDVDLLAHAAFVLRMSGPNGSRLGHASLLTVRG